MSFGDLAAVDHEAEVGLGMTISKKEWSAIEEKIEESIEAASEALSSKAVASLRKEIDAFRPHGWRRWLFLLRELGILGVNATVFVALLALAASQFYFANSRLAKEAGFESDTSNALSQIKLRLDSIDKQSSRTSAYVKSLNDKDILRTVGLPQTQFEKNLGALSGQLRSAVSLQDVPQLGTLRMISAKLDKAPTRLPDYWPALGALATAYSTSGKDEYVLAAMMNLPDCPRTQPQGRAGSDGYIHNKSVDCAWVLDGAIYRHMVFENLVIKSRGAGFILQDVRFINCIFVFELPSAPSDPSRRLTKEILANADQKTFTISSLGEPSPAPS
jgi:hypothetical protein